MNFNQHKLSSNVVTDCFFSLLKPRPGYEVSAMGRSLIQRNPNGCGVSNWTWLGKPQLEKAKADESCWGIKKIAGLTRKRFGTVHIKASNFLTYDIITSEHILCVAIFSLVMKKGSKHVATIWKMSIPGISLWQIFIFHQAHVTLTYKNTVLSPRHVSVQVAPSSGNCRYLYLLQLSRSLVHKSMQQNVQYTARTQHSHTHTHTHQ